MTKQEALTFFGELLRQENEWLWCLPYKDNERKWDAFGCKVDTPDLRDRCNRCAAALYIHGMGVWVTRDKDPHEALRRLEKGTRELLREGTELCASIPSGAGRAMQEPKALTFFGEPLRQFGEHLWYLQSAEDDGKWDIFDCAVRRSEHNDAELRYAADLYINRLFVWGELHQDPHKALHKLEEVMRELVREGTELCGGKVDES